MVKFHAEQVKAGTPYDLAHHNTQFQLNTPRQNYKEEKLGSGGDKCSPVVVPSLHLVRLVAYEV